MSIDAKHPAKSTATRDDCVEFIGVDWKGYDAILQARGERSAPKIIYLEGRVTLVSPSFSHEYSKERLSDFVKIVCKVLDFAFVPAAATTFRRRARSGGAEPDASFYFEGSDRIRNNLRIDLRRDPAPDLVIEVVRSRGGRDAISVWKRLGVKEIWVCGTQLIRFHVRGEDGRYNVSDVSRVLSPLTSTHVFHWTNEPPISILAWQDEVAEWARESLLPLRDQERPS